MKNEIANNLMVSVFMVTYNHVGFIEQAIESIMRQRTDFPIKLFIGEDFSTDGTREICLILAEKYKDRIELVLREKNVGAIANALEIWQKCFDYGKYTAICEGDDYWIDPLKLQKQVDFLETNPNFVMCHHDVEIITEDKSINNQFRKSYWFDFDVPEVSSFEDLAMLHHIATPSTLFRNGILDRFPTWYGDILCTDYIMHLLIAQHGKIRFMNEIMSAYRVHGGGIWSGKKSQDQILNSIEVITRSHQHFFPRASSNFFSYETSKFEQLCSLSFEEGEYKLFRNAYYNLLKRIKYVDRRLLFGLGLRYLLSFTPSNIKRYSRISSRIKQILKEVNRSKN